MRMKTICDGYFPQELLEKDDVCERSSNHSPMRMEGAKPMPNEKGEGPDNNNLKQLPPFSLTP